MTQITEDYVSFETAKLLKEKGFNEICHSVYDDKVLCSVASLNRHYECGYGDLVITCQNTDYDDWENKIAAPTLQMAMKWLREVHNIHIMVDCIGSKNYLPTAQYTKNSKDLIIEGSKSKIGGRGMDSYEEACEEAIKYCLENLI